MNHRSKKQRAVWPRQRQRIWEARVAVGIFGLLTIMHAAMAVGAIFEERILGGVAMAAATTVFYGLTCCAWRDASRG